jgi:hypothetical protein
LLFGTSTSSCGCMERSASSCDRVPGGERITCQRLLCASVLFATRTVSTVLRSGGLVGIRVPLHPWRWNDASPNGSLPSGPINQKGTVAEPLQKKLSGVDISRGKQLPVAIRSSYLKSVHDACSSGPSLGDVAWRRIATHEPEDGIRSRRLASGRRPRTDRTFDQSLGCHNDFR